MIKTSVFEDTYRDYLLMLERGDYLSKALRLGVEIQDRELVVPFYDRILMVSPQGIEDPSGEEVSHSVRITLCRYILNCPEEPPSDSSQLVTFREFKDAAPLTHHFVSNTNKTIESGFSGKVDLLRSQCLALGGTIENSPTHDLSVIFMALPRIPVYLKFNDRDDLFPAVCSILYRRTAEYYLDMEALSITGTYLTGRLISNH